MNAFFYSYIAVWSTACVVAIVLMVLDRKTIILFKKSYLDFLFIKWKLITFIIAISAFIVLAPYTGDPTWDYYDAAFMSIFTYLSAPWAVGTLFRFIKKREKIRTAFIAVCVWLFSASWSYDIYIVFRDGYYPLTWAANIVASSVIYLSAGLFWNLQYKQGKGVNFGFMEQDWPVVADTRFNRILLYALPFMLLAASVFIPFLI